MSTIPDALRRACHDNIGDPRTLVLIAALAFGLVAAVLPPIATTRSGVDILIVVDITGSMNTRDYQVAGQPVSRLDVAKAALKQMIGDLPCPSRVGLALFSERIPFLLFEPIDVCEDYGAVGGAIDAINWREAWDGDSHIASGLFRAIEMAKGLKSDLVFITDGQEAPPLPLSGGPAFDGQVGAVKGVIVGAGGYALSPIPKFDDRGDEIGFWGVDDVPHENRFGPPPADAASRPGYEPRNAPFGAVAAKGTEHLSSVREPYLKSRAAEIGLAYAHMADAGGLADALLPVATRHFSKGYADWRWLPGALALVALLILYGVFPTLDRQLHWKRT
ncbi:VWA domain-containing protein [Bradyrhizobium sp. SK17]|jgi:mxaL protein|uniref:vWA domain-containing protein n=1 Tax=Bradyrhizobium sp. SK17 TaxID=2057741 RepID=UPI000C30E0F2|nr:vWA domain-containing protein [Bradyrhizobium sp. SK17]AUC95614.1 VWA domain-containing protein [Bradyrhizobium sp. SK17]